MTETKFDDLPKWLWLWLPLGVAMFPYVARFINPETDLFVFGEQGIIENYTFVVLFIAIVLGIAAIRKMQSFPFRVFSILVGIISTGLYLLCG